MKPRSLLTGLVGLALAGYATVVWLGYRAERAPAAFVERFGGALRWVGPPSAELTEAAEAAMLEGLAALNDLERPPAARLAAHRESLRRAERLLIESLRTQPTQAGALAMLAGVRWELAPAVSGPELESQLRLIDRAGAMAPHRPAVQRDLGRLLLQMGRPVEGFEFLARAVSLDPRLAREIVLLLLERGLPPRRVADVLPPVAQTVVALERPFRHAGQEAEYVEWVERHLEPLDREILAVWATSLLRLGQADRLLTALDRLGSVEDAPLEAQRLLERARALVELGRPAEGLTQAALALELDPEHAQLAEATGRVALRGGDPDLAVRAFDEALARAVRQRAPSRVRARLYRRIGEAEEARGRMDRAYDAYRRAIELRPDEPHASRRLREMRAAAGAASPP